MATLLTSILTGNIVKPLRTKVPELNYISVDWGRSPEGVFVQPVKWDQEVISWLLTAPTASAHVPGAGLAPSPQNSKDLLTDIKVRINMAAKVSFKLPTADAIAYLLSGAMVATMGEGAVSLGRYVIQKVVEKFNSANFSQEYLSTKAAVEADHLTDVRAKLNKLGTQSPRFVLGETDWVKQLAKDPEIKSGDYYGQLVGEDPYITLVNIDGFKEVREWPNMPTNTVDVGAVTADATADTLTLAAHGLRNGDRVRFTTTSALPAGISADTDHYVIATATNTFQISLTPGGSAVNITSTGTGVHTVQRFEALNAMAFERRAAHVAFRSLLDNSEVARMLGIPETSKKVREVDADSGLAIDWHLWEDATGTNPTGDVFATGVVAFGIVAGREIISATAPGEQAAGAGQMDYSGCRLVETAKSA